MPFLIVRKRGKGEVTELTVSPYLAVITSAAQVMARAATEMGFSPAARPRLAQSNPGAAIPNDSPWHRLKLLQGGRKEGA
jgi:phage terminase small subunit